MGCCTSIAVKTNPGKVHMKKINEIKEAFIKNQGLNPKTYMGKNTLTVDITENIERHAKSTTKDLVRIIQIDARFVPKICHYLAKKITTQVISLEFQYLYLMLMKELMQTPNEQNKGKNVKPGKKQRFIRAMKRGTKSTKKNLAQIKRRMSIKKGSSVRRGNTMRRLKQNGGEQTPSSKEFDTKSNGNYQINAQSNQSQIVYGRDQQQHTEEVQNNNINMVENANSECEYRFCQDNERLIFQVLESVVLKDEQNSDNTCFFAYQAIQMVNTLLDNVQKSQLQEQQDQYVKFVQKLFDDKQNKWSTEIQYEAQKAYLKLLQQMKDSSFKQQFSNIFELCWSLVSQSRDYIENLEHGDEDDEDSNQISEEEEIIDTNKINIQLDQNQGEFSPVQHRMFELAFEMLSYLSLRLSNDLESDDYIEKSLLTKIFEQFSIDNWQSINFIKFVLLVLICNGKNKKYQFDRESISERLVALVVSHNDQNQPNASVIDQAIMDKVMTNLFEKIKTCMYKRNAQESKKIIAQLVIISDLSCLQVAKKQVEILDTFKDIIDYTNCIKQQNNQNDVVCSEIQNANIIAVERYLDIFKQADELIDVLKSWFRICQDEFDQLQTQKQNDKYKGQQTMNILGAMLHFIQIQFTSQNYEQMELLDEAARRLSNDIDTDTAKSMSPMLKMKSVQSGFLNSSKDKVISKSNSLNLNTSINPPKQIKLIKIESQILMITIARRALIDNDKDMAVQAIGYDLQMKFINKEINECVQHDQQQPFSVDALLQYLTILADFFRLTIEQPDIDVALYLQDIWNLLNSALIARSSYIGYLLGFLVYAFEKLQKSKAKGLEIYKYLCFFLLARTSHTFDLIGMRNLFSNLRNELTNAQDMWQKLPIRDSTQNLVEQFEAIHSGLSTNQLNQSKDEEQLNNLIDLINKKPNNLQKVFEDEISRLGYDTKHLNSALDSFNQVTQNMGYQNVPKHKNSSLNGSEILKDISQKFQINDDQSMSFTVEDNQQQPANLNDRLFSDQLLVSQSSISYSQLQD